MKHNEHVISHYLFMYLTAQRLGFVMSADLNWQWFSWELNDNWYSN